MWLRLPKNWPISASPARVCLRESHIASIRGWLTALVRSPDCSDCGSSPKTSQTACCTSASLTARGAAPDDSLKRFVHQRHRRRPPEGAAGGVELVDGADQFAHVLRETRRPGAWRRRRSGSAQATRRIAARSFRAWRALAVRSGRPAPRTRRDSNSGPSPARFAGARSAANTICLPPRCNVSIVCSSSTSVTFLPAKNCKSSISSRSTLRCLWRKLGRPLLMQGFEKVAGELLGREIDGVQARVAALGGAPDPFEQVRLAHPRRPVNHQRRDATWVLGHFSGAGGGHAVAGCRR